MIHVRHFHWNFSLPMWTKRRHIEYNTVQDRTVPKVPLELPTAERSAIISEVE